MLNTNTKNTIRKINFIAGCIFLIATAGCGGGGSNNNEGVNGLYNIDTGGGAIEKEGVATLEFPAGAFRLSSELTIEEEANADILDDYEISSVMFSSGLSFDRYLVVTSTEAPEMDATIRYIVPQDFLGQLGDDYRPRLFVKIYQLGSNDEHLDYFEPLDFNLEGDVLTATVPRETFTDLRSGDGLFEAIILIGSSPTNRVEVVNDHGTKSLDGFKEAGSGECLGATIGSPLNGDLSVTSAFGSREHPISKNLVKHMGVDLAANTGDEVYVVADGTVDRVGYNHNKNTEKGYGRYIILRHTDGSKTLYAHLVKSSTDHLTEGQAVTKGFVIGRANSSGGVTGPHLHFEYAPNGEIFNKDAKIDPHPCINANLTGQITLSDNGNLADDSFSLTLDGVLIGTTGIGASNTFAINNLRLGEHTIKIDAVYVPDDVGTLQIDLGDGVEFTDGTQSRSETLSPGGSVTYTIVVEY